MEISTQRRKGRRETHFLFGGEITPNKKVLIPKGRSFWSNRPARGGIGAEEESLLRVLRVWFIFVKSFFISIVLESQ
jgi:hypothetical protein